MGSSGKSAGGGGAPLVSTTLLNSSSQSISATTSWASVDSTNLKLTFTAPGSGKVNVLLQAIAQPDASTAANWLAWALWDNSSVLYGAATQVAQQINNNVSGNSQPRVTQAIFIPVSGLTAGSSYTFYWASRASGTGCATIYGGQIGGVNASPAFFAIFTG